MVQNCMRIYFKGLTVENDRMLYFLSSLFFRVDIKMPGTYSFCFDNTFSRMSRKVVFFEILDDDDDDGEEWKPNKEEIADLMDMTVEDFKVSFYRKYLQQMHTW